MPITIQLPPETERRLTELANRTGRDVDFYLREMVQRGLEDVKDYYSAEQPLNPEIPSLKSLRAKYLSRKDELSGNRRVRIRRGLSWTERARQELDADDPDAAFIFYWIGFEALYSEPRPSSHGDAKKERDAFLDIVFGLDVGQDALIYNSVIASESKTILTLVANAYAFTPFWERYHVGEKSQSPDEWANPLIESVTQMIADLERREGGTQRALGILFDRLRELRNELVHGGATWEDSANRDQVKDGARIMSRLLPVFLDLMMDYPGRFSDSDANYPPPDMDPDHITDEHNAYVCRLAEMTRYVYNSEYREYLSEAIERELTAKRDAKLTARVHAILYQRNWRGMRP